MEDRNGFFCYKGYVEEPRKVLTAEQYSEYAVCLIELGIYGSCTVSDRDVAAFLEEKCALMDAADRRYLHSKRTGKLGGRQRIVEVSQIKEAIRKEGFQTQQELANFFGCSLRTIQRRINSAEIKQCYGENHGKI